MKINYKILAQQYVNYIKEHNWNYSLLDDIIEMLPRKFGIDLTIKQYGKLMKEIEKLLP